MFFNLKWRFTCWWLIHVIGFEKEARDYIDAVRENRFGWVPPHPNCRCVIDPVTSASEIDYSFDDDFLIELKRKKEHGRFN